MIYRSANRQPVAGHVPDAGDIIWLNAGPTKGHEQDAFRPWVCLSGKAFNDASGLAHCVPCTTNVKDSQWEVEIPGLPKKTAALWAHGKTLDWRARGAVHYGETASEDVMNRIKLRIARLLDIPILK
ncbi:type II toxin-antitoxin system PemK/MazF family toxin [Burkholderia ubonensis]|uniref:type II toxin-antitoxin system PemK/MazF family toxin n=1 Tax=Burkholderia ubonensis TaxID=101571 RepID=UPI0009B3118C|nr:type II toxin-antitoxin system PemK/MazF family toxin [Burkholderia ubonensis]